MVISILIIALMYTLFRLFRAKNLAKRIELLEKRVDKLEKDVKFVVLYMKDN